MNTKQAATIALVTLIAVLAVPAAGAEGEEQPASGGDESCPILETASYPPYFEVHEECLTSWP
jgi:hypothetical protein